MGRIDEDGYPRPPGGFDRARFIDNMVLFRSGFAVGLRVGLAETGPR